VRVPIDRAMDMLIEQKLPVRQAAPPTENATDSKKEAAK
jgi:hypothetical protein